MKYDGQTVLGEAVLSVWDPSVSTTLMGSAHATSRRRRAAFTVRGH